LRQTNNTHLAEEIAQAVFIILARKAASLGKDTILPAWLYRATRYAVADVLKQQRRRQAREHEAYMQSTVQTEETDAAWLQLAPMLDDAMADLGEHDRAAVVLRYFENCPWQEVAALLKMTEDAAQKRVTRALEKLRKLLAKRGVVLGSTAIAAAVAANAVTAAPTALAATITTATLTGTSLTLATVAMTSLQKIAVTAALTTTICGGLYAAKQASDARIELQKLQTQQAPLTAQIQQLQAERDQAKNVVAGLKEELAQNEKRNLELLKLRGQVGVLHSQLAEPNTIKPKIEQPPLSSANEYYERAKKHEANKQFEAALDDVNKAIEMDPNNADAYNTRIILYVNYLPKAYGGTENALADYTRLLELKPTDWWARQGRASLYAATGQNDKAIDDYTTMIRGGTDYSPEAETKNKLVAQAYFERGRIYDLNLQDYSKAIADFTAALQFDPQISENVHRYRGECYEQLGESDKAQQDFAMEPKGK
jgi:RNA polymerase sigma factor (sigma-70 family)